MIIYVTGRPEFQKDAVITWLAKHQFPVGVVSCAETISTVSEVRTSKILYLGRLIRQVINPSLLSFHLSVCVEHKTLTTYVVSVSSLYECLHIFKQPTANVTHIAYELLVNKN